MNALRFSSIPAGPRARVQNRQRALVIVLLSWALFKMGLALAAVWHNRIMRAEIGMGSGLIIFWVLTGAGLMYFCRDHVKAALNPTASNWRISFFLMTVALAMSEEVVTTLMTNGAPLFGVKVGEAYITASANYFDVITCHSVVVFLPAFAAWVWLYSRYDFSPFEVFICFGLYGFFGESVLGGFHPADLPFWIFVYGLMMYLPAYVFAELRGRRPVRWWHYILASVGPYVCTIPWVLLLKATWLRHHPDVHFPPIHAN